MSNLKVSLILEAIDRMTAPIRNMSARVSSLTGRMAQSFRHAGDQMMLLGRAASNVGAALSTRLTTAMAGVGFLTLRAAGNVETLSIKFESLLGSQEQALAMTKELTNFAAKTPFEMNGVSQAAIYLLTAGTAAEEMTYRLSVLGDIAALAGEDIGELGKIYGRVKSSQVAYTMELEMLNDRGVPIWNELAKVTGKSVKQIRKDTADGKITFELFEEALESMRNAGGPAFEQMTKQGKSWNGSLSTLSDSFTQMMARIGEVSIKNLELKALIERLTGGIEDLTKAFTNLSPQYQKWIVLGGMVLGVMGPLLLTIGQFAIGLGWIMKGTVGTVASLVWLSSIIFKTLIPALWGATLATGRLAIAFMATPLGWITAGIAALTTAGYLIIKNWDAIKDAWSGIWDAITARVQQAVAFIQPLIDRISSGINMLRDNAVTRGISTAVNYVSDTGTSAVNYMTGTPQKVDAGGELRIVIDENRPARASVVMNNPAIKTSLNQGVIMGGGL